VAGQGTPATALLGKLGIAHSVHEYPHDPRHGSYGAEAAQVLGVAPERVFKTLVAEVEGQLIVGVVPVAGQLDLKALAAAAGGKKAAMAAVAASERATGYVTGGISPLGHRRRLPVVVDSSALGSRRSTAALAGAAWRSSWHRPTWCAPRARWSPTSPRRPAAEISRSGSQVSRRRGRSWG
jgi:Cys-tRNA(Pro)/Cys-tRNA(Cys) deacylase